MKYPVMRPALLASALLAITFPAYSFNLTPLDTIGALQTGGWSLADFLAWLLQQIHVWFGNSNGGSSGQPVPVAEPGVSLLLLTALAGTGIYRWHRKHRA